MICAEQTRARRALPDWLRRLACRNSSVLRSLRGGERNVTKSLADRFWADDALLVEGRRWVLPVRPPYGSATICPELLARIRRQLSSNANWHSGGIQVPACRMKAFRSFAPSVLRKDVADWFELECDSPYMLLVAGVAAGHRWEMTDEEKGRFGIDGLHYFARIQTVHQETNPRYYDLIAAFKARTGCPVIVNTSFNIRGEPIVCTPEDAFRCFMGTEIDRLAIGNCFLHKEDQDPELKRDYQSAFEPD